MIVAGDWRLVGVGCTGVTWSNWTRNTAGADGRRAHEVVVPDQGQRAGQPGGVVLGAAGEPVLATSEGLAAPPPTGDNRAHRAPCPGRAGQARGTRANDVTRVIFRCRPGVTGVATPRFTGLPPAPAAT